MPSKPSAKVTKVRIQKSHLRLWQWKTLVFVLAFTFLGSAFVRNSFAATPVLATVQAEQMTLPAGASIIRSSSASKGEAVELTKSGTSLTGSVILPSNATSVSIVARGAKCQRSWPAMTASIDGNAVFTNVSVNNSNWNNYSANVALTGATHTLSIADTGSNACSDLTVDDIIFYGPIAVAPAPTISFSATPASIAAGAVSTLTWSSANASSCVASGAWTGSEPTSGSVSTGILNTSSTYSLSCSGTGGKTSATTSVTVTPGSGSTTACQSVAIPAYFYPTSTSNPWTTAAAAEPGVGIMIANVNNGSGTAVDPSYSSAIANARAAGSKVFGYVYTEYGANSIASVEANINTWKSLYNVTNIFIDQTATSASTEPYYQALSTYVHQQTAGSLTILNPGTVPDPSYINAGDIIITFEDSYSSYQKTTFPSWTTKYPANRFYNIVYNVSSQSSMTQVLKQAAKDNVGYIYATNDNLPNPYDTVPPYLAAEASGANSTCSP